MTIEQRYSVAKERYKEIGIDTDMVLKTLKDVPISMHCWQGDDVIGFEGGMGLTGGIQATGNYPGRARDPKELMADMDQALSLIPGTHRINLHASYAIMTNENMADRDQLRPEHFTAWVAFAKERGLGIDFNPTFFSHKMAESGLTLSSPDEKIRQFWVRHAISCRKIAEYFGRELGSSCLCNIWIPDGYKDIPADRLGPRKRLLQSLDEIYAVKLDNQYLLDAVESKVFGIGLESFTVGSHEFYLNYAAKHGILCLLDNGHFHPTEQISDKIPSLLLFADRLALHVTRPVRWDSDHVVLFDDELKEIAKEIVRCDALQRVMIGLDYFDASINRISAWVVGMRNMQKALLNALLVPWKQFKKLQESGNFTELMGYSEELKLMPIGDVWDYFCIQNGVPTGWNWLDVVKQYENEVLSKRI